MPMAIGNLNTLVIDQPIKVQIETFYDMSLVENWDDKCILWSVEDEGSVYKHEIPLTDTTFVEKEDKHIKVLFEEVLADHKYSCVIDQGDNKSIVLFQNLEITEDMAYEEQES